MRPLIQEIQTAHTPESLVGQVRNAECGMRNAILLRSNSFGSAQARYSFVAANPFLVFKSFGSRCEIIPHSAFLTPHFGNPWHLLDALMSRFELLDEIDLPFPLGGAFGYWGYDLKNFTEPKLPRRAVNDLELPDCHVGFYDSLVVFDHHLGKIFIVSTGLNADGSRSETRANEKMEFWNSIISKTELPQRRRDAETEFFSPRLRASAVEINSNFSRHDFISAVERAQKCIRAGDIYQVNLSHRLTAELVFNHQDTKTPSETDFHNEESLVPWCLGGKTFAGWEFFEKLSAVSPAPFSAFLDCGEFQIASSSPEQFLRMSGSQIITRPIKGTRPRDADPTRDAQLAYELQTSAKELSELVMITDLLRNDLGKVCEFGSVQVPELAKLEKFAQVQHLVSTIEGELKKSVTHFAAFASCFPGGSITGAPKFRAMEIIDELEPISRGPYCGAIGYLGFNRESQLSIAIRTAICAREKIYFNVGAGIVADSNPESEYEETLAKARGFFAALENCRSRREEAHFKIENGKLI
ncbi:MAG TPA: anthranilate synthase component I family protein [Verrucomicrobiae bacterium]|jgi:para-aminobenzoate synthetase component 1